MQLTTEIRPQKSAFEICLVDYKRAMIQIWYLCVMLNFGCKSTIYHQGFSLIVWQNNWRISLGNSWNMIENR
ncbi:hypothetical protein V6Z12_A10G182700 [Gossypium hirsutum]